MTSSAGLLRRKRARGELKQALVELSRHGYSYCKNLEIAVSERMRANSYEYDCRVKALEWGVREANSLLAQIEANKRLKAGSEEYDEIMAGREAMEGL